MLDCQVAVLENAFARYLNTGEIPRPLGTRHPVMTPFQVFQTKDGYIAVATRGGIKDQWPLLCAAIDHVELIDDPRFLDGWTRTQNYDVLEPILNEAMMTRTTEEWVKELEAVKIPCGPVNTIDKVANDPQIAVRNMIIDVCDAEAGCFKLVNNPFKFSRTPCHVEGMAPELGEDTEQVFKDWLRMSAEEIEKLKRDRII